MGSKSVVVKLRRIFVLFNVTCALFSVQVNSQSPECGTIDQVLAQQDPRAQVPWIASLYFQSTQCDFRPAGNGHGVIIGPTEILMKGKFMWSNDGYGTVRMNSYSPNYFMVVVGLKSKAPFIPDQHTQFLKIANVQPHPLSYDAYGEYDYAVVHLKNPIQFTSFVRPLCVDVLPEGIFDRSNRSILNDHFKITGFRTGTGKNSFRSALHPASERFGLLSREVCINKLQYDLSRTSPSSSLIKEDAPCGLSAKGLEDAEDEFLDVRSVIGGGSQTINALRVPNLASMDYLSHLLNFSHLEAQKGHRPLPNICFQTGSSIVTLYKGKWHLAGLVTESLGLTCESNLYFLSFVASRNNLNWILQHIRHGPTAFICTNGQEIDIKGTLCNGKQDCLDGTDEESKMCECRPDCDNNRCLLQPMCKHCKPSDTLKVLQQTYTFSTAVSTVKKECNPVFPPSGTAVYCKAPGLTSRIPCERRHFPGTQAVFSSQRFDSSAPALYCVLTCKDDGKWSYELNEYQCRIFFTKPTKEEETKTAIENLPVRGNIPGSQTHNNPSVVNIRPSIGETSDALQFQHQTFKDKDGTLLCPPIKAVKGTKVMCWSKTPSNSIPCNEPMYPGSKAEFECNEYYKPLLTRSPVTKQCLPGGEWSLSNRSFDCRLDCGIPKSNLQGHIVFGRETEGAKWPWHGLIFIDIGRHNYTYICGSTLISKRVLVTAAHCVTDKNGNAKTPSIYKVVLAATSNVYHKNILDENIQIFDVTKINVQPLFNAGNFEADIAILQLSRQIEVSDYVRPSCYPTTVHDRTELKHLSPGSVGEVVGFGYDETGKPSTTLKESGLPVVSYKECYEVSKIRHSPTQYCAGFTNGTSVCNGDSGSGQFFEEEIPYKKIYLQGIVSHGNRDETSRLCDHNQYSVFTKVGAFKNWISEVGYELDEDF